MNSERLEARADELVAGDLARARMLHDAIMDAYRIVSTVSFDTVDWPVSGWDRAETLRALAELAGPRHLDAVQKGEMWQQALQDVQEEEASWRPDYDAERE
jgi:hypothetical protein